MSSLFIKIWDVQHGLAIYVRTPNGKHIVIDLGLGDTSGNTGNWKDFSPLRHLKYSYKIPQLDELIITHPHTDHIDDINNLSLLPPISLLAPTLIPEVDIRKGNRLGDAPKIDSYLALIRRYTVSVPDSTNPQEAAYNGGVEIQHFIPTLETSNLNDRSIVVFLTYANSTICIPGDNEKASWKELLSKPAFRQLLSLTNVFVASHHGRASGFYDEVFTYCKPSIVIISDGPQQETCVADDYRRKVVEPGWPVHSLSGGESKNRKVLTTRSDGAIQIECFFDADGKNYRVIHKE